MRYQKVFCILVLAALLSLQAMVAIPATPVLAQSITLSPTSGSVGTEVTITGTDFVFYKNSHVDLYFGNHLMKSIKIPKTGVFTVYFNVPRYVESGTTHRVAVKNEYGTELTVGSFTVTAKIILDPGKGEIGEWTKIFGRGFNSIIKEVGLYFSSDKANIGDKIDSAVTAHKYIGGASINEGGYFDTQPNFQIPDELKDGKDKEDVHVGSYYIYACAFTPWDDRRIEAVARFVIIGGKIELDLQEGPVDSEVEIRGEGFRNSQEIAVKYGGKNIEMASGDNETGADGQFTCAIIIPESVAGTYVIAVTDESGNKHEAEFSVKPRITIAPNFGAAGNEVKVSGTGFAGEEYITIIVDDDEEVLTKPELVQTNPSGSFKGSFIIPFNPSRVGISRSKVVVLDGTFNTAEAQLIVLATPAAITLQPAANLTSPGYVGMELTVNGTGFTANATVTITYGNYETITVATATTDAYGKSSATFTVPSSAAGSHAVTATDNINSVTSVLTMESELPPIPILLVPEVFITAETRAYFDWEDVEDSSGVTYTLQVASDAGFANKVLEQKGLTHSEYPIIVEEQFEPDGMETPYYWRVKAIDGAFNESGWTPSGSLYIYSPQTPGQKPAPGILAHGIWDMGKWVLGIGIGFLGALLLVLHLRRRRGAD
ncbi:IPT/TIG domain-containing protein [Chloroflexota bacterium]